MLDDAKELPNDPAALKGLVASLASEVKHQALFIEKLGPPPLSWSTVIVRKRRINSVREDQRSRII